MSIGNQVQVALQKTLSHLRVYPWPFFVVYNPSSFAVKGEHYYNIRNIIQPGDIVLRAYKDYLDGWLIRVLTKGWFSHAGIYIGTQPLAPTNEAIIHAIGSGVEFTNLATFTRCDVFAIIRSNLPTPAISEVIHKAVNTIGYRYDFDFIFDETEAELQGKANRSFSCSELVYYCFEDFAKELQFELIEQNYWLLQRKVFSPMDIWNASLKTASQASIPYLFNKKEIINLK